MKKSGRGNRKSYPYLVPAAILASLLGLILAGCGATVTPPTPVFLRAAGSTSMTPLLSELTTAYSEDQPHVAFDIQGGGSQLGQALVEAGQADLGLVSWPPPNLADNTRLVPIARDSIAIIVHPQNEVTGLSLVELRDIFSGHLLDWREVDSLPLPIQVVSREDGSGTRAAFETTVMADRAVTPTAIVLPNSGAVVDYVAQHPRAVAYVSATFADESVSAVPIEGVSPTLDNLRANSYPLNRELSLILAESENPDVQNFVDFALSPAGQAIVGKRWGQIR